MAGLCTCASEYERTGFHELSFMGREYDSAEKAPMTRRQLLGRVGTGFGLVGLASNLGPRLAGAASVDPGVNPLAPKPPHFPAKAKHVIFLLMNGGVSHVDTFDPNRRWTSTMASRYPEVIPRRSGRRATSCARLFSSGNTVRAACR